MAVNFDHLEQEIAKTGREIFAELARPASRSVFDSQYYTDKFLSWGMQDEEFKVSLFRFVDVLPSLRDSAAVITHVQEYFGPLRGKLPELLHRGLEIRPSSLAAKLAAAAIRKQVRSIAEHFIVGESATAALKPLRLLRRNGQAFTVDLLGEATVSESEAVAYQDRYKGLLHVLSKEVPKWPERLPLMAGHRGEETPINISVKLSALYSQARPLNTDKTRQIFSERLAEIFSEAQKIGAFVYVDMEDCSLTSVTLQTFKSVLASSEFKTYPKFGIVLQAYLRRTSEDLRDLIRWTKSRGTPIAVRLVKGAYWDTETILAKQHRWPIPVWQQKECSDANYEQLSLQLLEHRDLILPAFASHNVRSLLHAVKAAELMDIAPTEFEIQTLYGMGETIAGAFASRGYLVRNYAPIGDLIPGMGYLVRRLLENTSNEGFLRQSMHEHRDPDLLLRQPHFVSSDTGTQHLKRGGVDDFSNTPLRDFTIPEERQNILRELFRLRAEAEKEPVRIRPILNGKPEVGGAAFPSLSPEDQHLVLALVEPARAETVQTAILALERSFPAWRAESVTERIAVLLRTADILEAQRAELTALIVLEAGKPWLEADADVAEAIDFLRYYAVQAKKLFEGKPAPNIAGEHNSYFYEPRGVCAVISPWNFPLAIPCGMFAAALVCGNCAILKPAEQTSRIAQRLFAAFLQAGLPPEAAAFLPGIGEEIGPVLMQSPAVTTVVFTGSLDVGMTLFRQGAETSTGAQHVKRVIAEMGGKNAVIVDEDADFDEAIKGIVYSAFGYQGQKCSACSRVIVVGKNFEHFAARLAEATQSILVGPSSDPSTFIGPVIDREAQERILAAIDAARADCTLLVEGNVPQASGSGLFVPPTIFTDIPDNHPILSQEIFGPVLALLRAPDFETALYLANDSKYGLTGAVFSRSPKNIELATQEFRVGNLYINRGCTGAYVMRQPFGGAKMSGVGSKAGGPDYLLQFVIPRVITENTLRRGFAPAV
jgi:RHH-type proline utilization regulon transcriptional repressor/proline dehydrogenase/delta 1-pyrroline-5-carboxylate dehydrogenase